MSRWSKAFYIFAIPVSALAGLGYANGVNYSLHLKNLYSRFNKCIECKECKENKDKPEN